MKEVRLRIGDQLIQRKVSFPFQMRWQPTAADVGQTRTLVVDAEDKAGNVTTTARTITVAAPNAMEESPLPTGVTTVAGKAVLGETLTCIPSGFSGNGVTISYQWLRAGAAIAGATGATYVPVAADVGRTVSCRATAANSAGDADSTSAALTVSTAAAGPVGPRGPRGPQAIVGPTPRVRVACSMGKRRRITCVVRPTVTSRVRASATIRVRGKKATARGRGTLRVRLTAPKAMKRTDRFTVTYVRGDRQARVLVRLGRTTTKAMARR